MWRNRERRLVRANAGGRRHFFVLGPVGSPRAKLCRYERRFLVRGAIVAGTDEVVPLGAAFLRPRAILETTDEVVPPRVGPGHSPALDGLTDHR
jgi:hypothetical protein